MTWKKYNYFNLVVIENCMWALFWRCKASQKYRFKYSQCNRNIVITTLEIEHISLARENMRLYDKWCRILATIVILVRTQSTSPVICAINDVSLINESHLHEKSDTY